MIFRWSAAAAVLAATIGMPSLGHAFMAKSPSSQLLTKPIARGPATSSSYFSSSLYMGPPSDPSAPLTERYGEGSRKYRRTVYTHDQWVKHRSSDRFVNNLGTLFQSGIYKQVGNEVFLTVGIAVAVCLWNALVGGYEDLSGVMHDPVIKESWAMKVGLPMEVFNILAPSLGLLLVFRTNASYKRWDEARKFWGLNINHTRDLNRMATAWYGNQSDWDDTDDFMGTGTTTPEFKIDPVERHYLLGQVSLATWAFVRSMKRHLSPPEEDEENYIAEIESRMSPRQAKALISATHRPNRALYDLSTAIEKLPMHFVRKNAINQNLSIFEDTLGGSERLLSSPVPLFYSRHMARFLSTWLLALPLGLYGPFATSWNHVMMIPATAFVSVALFGIEELATQLEEPFTILPMQGFCDKIGANCFEIVSWAGQGQESEGEVEAAKTKTLEVETFVPIQSSATPTVSTIAEPTNPSAVDILYAALISPLFNPTVLKDVPIEVIQGAAISGVSLTLLASAIRDGPLSLASPSTLIEAVSVGTVFAYVSIIEGAAGDIIRGVGTTTMDMVGLTATDNVDEEEDINDDLEAASSLVEPTSGASLTEILPKESLPFTDELSVDTQVADDEPEEQAGFEPTTSPFLAEKTSSSVREEEVSPVREVTENENVAIELTEDIKFEEDVTKEVNVMQEQIDNRVRRRMSLKERLGQIEEGQDIVKNPSAKEMKPEETKLEDVRPEENMEKISDKPVKMENRNPSSLSLREIVSQMK